MSPSLSRAKMRSSAAAAAAPTTSPIWRRSAQHLHHDTGASFWRSCLNLSNVISGVGLLSVPYALAQGGWLSLALFAVIGAVCYYTSELIARCMRAGGDASYPDIGHLAFGRPGRKTIGAVMYGELYLVAISFLILEGDNLDKLLPGTAVGLSGGYVLRGKQLFTLAAAGVVLL